VSDTSTAEQFGSSRVKRGLAEMLKGGVIMDVVTPEQARIAEDAGAVAVMALERVPADIRSQGGVARMSDPDLIEAIIAEVSIPVMAKARIGHFVECQVGFAIAPVSSRPHSSQRICRSSRPLASTTSTSLRS
jgi:pyridoxal 5'-phosphate synthase pdxS subunit